MKLNIFNWFKRHLPLLVVIVVALTVAVQNIDPNLHYAGWDNIHAEFDLLGYTKQILFGAWVEHQGLGAPAAQAQLADLFRLPILFFLNAFLPSNLVRYVFIFLMYAVGGIGTYLYLAKIWLKEKTGVFKNWLASLGAIFYLLHILTLQQFYISFEMFMVQFAFLPFLLLSIHGLIEKNSLKNIFLFILIQLLITPSAHTSTVFYLAVILSLLYSFFMTLGKGFMKAVATSLMIGLLTFLINAYWILPNIYYSLYHNDYVQQSRENRLFVPEAVWSIREAGTVENLTSGTHYLFNWSDYSFEKGEFEHIFNEWEDHLSQPQVSVLMKSLGIVTLLGLLFLAIDKEKGNKRWGIISMYLLCLVFIWIDLFPTKFIVDWLYQSGSFLEAFRNPFTKLSIIYSFLSIILFIQVIEWLVIIAQQSKILKISILLTFTIAVGYVAWPSFQGHFISEKLQIIYPPQYEQMFAYLRTRDKNLRILQLPQLSGVTWEYYDWSFLKPGNGYQGMGFYFFGFSQPFLNRDSDRWVETSDFFYHELKYALDNQDEDRFAEIVEKYNIDLIIVDETKIDPNRKHDYAIDHQLAQAIGFNKVVEQDFLTIYEGEDEDTLGGLIIPKTIQFIAGETNRARTDVIFQQEGNYLVVDESQALLWYPFASLATRELDNVNFTASGAEVITILADNDYTATLPGLKSTNYFIPAAITYSNGVVNVVFPKTTIATADQQFTLPRLANFEFKVAEELNSIIVFFNDLGVIVEKNQTAYPVIKTLVGQPITIDYAPKPEKIAYLESGEVDGSQLESTTIFDMVVNWPAFSEDLIFTTNGSTELKASSSFPIISIDLLRNPSVNCSTTERGEIKTELVDSSVIYKADSFAVNCNGYVFDHFSPTYPYIMKITGKNFQGRATKFFVSYSDLDISAESYLIQEPEFSTFITTSRVSTDPRSLLYLNWETRSHGKEGINELSSIDTTPFPVEQLSRLKLEKAAGLETTVNPIEIKSRQVFLETIYITKINCPAEKCYLGIDQSYDDLWLAIRTDRGKFLPHLRYNNWANIWEVTGEGTVVIFYLPSLVVLISLIGLPVGIKLLLPWLLKKS